MTRTPQHTPDTDYYIPTSTVIAPIDWIYVKLSG
jgi:hypothetical protein